MSALGGDVVVLIGWGAVVAVGLVFAGLYWWSGRQLERGFDWEDQCHADD